MMTTKNIAIKMPPLHSGSRVGKNYLLMFENYRIFVLMKSSNISKNQGTGHFAKIIHFRCENSKIKFVV